MLTTAQLLQVYIWPAAAVTQHIIPMADSLTEPLNVHACMHADTQLHLLKAHY